MIEKRQSAGETAGSRRRISAPHCVFSRQSYHPHIAKHPCQITETGLRRDTGTGYFIDTERGGGTHFTRENSVMRVFLRFPAYLDYCINRKKRGVRNRAAPRYRQGFFTDTGRGGERAFHAGNLCHAGFPAFSGLPRIPNKPEKKEIAKQGCPCSFPHDFHAPEYVIKGRRLPPAGRFSR